MEIGVYKHLVKLHNVLKFLSLLQFMPPDVDLFVLTVEEY